MLHWTTCNNDFSRNNVGNTLQVFDLGSKSRNVLPSQKLREKSCRVSCYTVFDFSRNTVAQKSLLQVVPCNITLNRPNSPFCGFAAPCPRARVNANKLQLRRLCFGKQLLTNLISRFFDTFIRVVKLKKSITLPSCFAARPLTY